MDSPLSTWTPASPALRAVPFLTQVNLRSSTPAAFEPVLGVPPPTTPNTVAVSGDLAVLWLGPDEWLVIAPPLGAAGSASGVVGSVSPVGLPVSGVVGSMLPEVGPRSAVVGPRSAPLAEALAEAVKGEFASVVDVSAHRTAIDVSGPHAWDLLAHGCALDGVAPGHCAQTMLARAGVILWRLDDGYRVLVRSSFARYVAAWLDDASVEH